MPNIQIIPGLLLAIFVAILARLIEGSLPFLTMIGAPAIALFIGAILGNLPHLFQWPGFAKGTRFSESKLLEFSVVLLGTSVTFQTLIHLGARGILFITLQMAITMGMAIMIGKRLKFSQSTALLMASGNAVCGSSAIAATAPIVGASDSERGVVITIVNLMGTIMMFTMPLIAWFLFQSATRESAALIGGTLQSVGQVVASASMVSSEVNDQAIIYKIVRILFIIVVVLLYSRIRHTQEQKALHHNNAEQDKSTLSSTTQASDYSPKKSSLKEKIGGFLTIIPWYVYAFLALCLINSFLPFPKMWVEPATTIRNAFELIALAAIGLRLNLAILKSQGSAFLLYGLSLGIIQSIAALLLVLLLIH